MRKRLAIVNPVDPALLREYTDDDRTRIAEAFSVAAGVGEALWSGWQEAPRSVLLVGRSQEYLVHHDDPGDDFTHVGYDSIVGSELYLRDRQHDYRLLATFPAVGRTSTIVIGKPQSTDASHSTRWVMTLLHEHFHQWQQSQEGYYEDVAALGLARGDQSGMWMLDYAFPYDSVPVNDLFSAMCVELAAALTSQASVRDYLEAKSRFREGLSKNDYAYFAFQVWQEGIARYTEIRVGESAAFSYQPTAAFEELPDFRPFGRDASEIRRHMWEELRSVSLKETKRSAFYFVGAAEGILLDRVVPGWRERYFHEKFNTDAYFDTFIESTE